MKIYLTSYYYIRFLKPNMIPVSTTGGDPTWYHENTRDQNRWFLDSNQVFNGIREETLSFPRDNFEKMTEQCQKNCPYRCKAPNCEFMNMYREYLRSLDFENYLIPEFKRIADDVKKINNYEGEPWIVLLTYEAPGCPCGEGPILKEVFEEHNIKIEYLTKQTLTLLNKEIYGEEIF